MKNKDEMPDYGGVIEMTNNMEIVEKLLMRKGRFVGDMVHISIADLAESIQRLEAEKAELVEVLRYAWLRMKTDKPTELEYVNQFLQKHKDTK